MTQFTLHCPLCAAELTLTARRLMVRVDAGSATSGEILFTCLSCRQTCAVTVDVNAVAALLSAGVTFLSMSEPRVDHPEAPPSGPPLNHDDLLDLHAALDGDTWFEQMVTSTGS
jgi:transcription elongation factor Elf1